MYPDWQMNFHESGYRIMVHSWFSSSPIGLSGSHVRLSTCSPTQNWASLVLLHSHTLIFLGLKRPLFGHSHLWTGVACRVHIVTGTAWLSKVKCCAQGSFRSHDLRTFCFYLINGSGSVYVSSMPSLHYLSLSLSACPAMRKLAKSEVRTNINWQRPAIAIFS